MAKPSRDTADRIRAAIAADSNPGAIRPAKPTARPSGGIDKTVKPGPPLRGRSALGSPTTQTRVGVMITGRSSSLRHTPEGLAPNNPRSIAKGDPGGRP